MHYFRKRSNHLSYRFPELKMDRFIQTLEVSTSHLLLSVQRGSLYQGRIYLHSHLAPDQVSQSAEVPKPTEGLGIIKPECIPLWMKWRVK